MGILGPDGKDVELAVGQVCELRNGDTITIKRGTDSYNWPWLGSNNRDYRRCGRLMKGVDTEHDIIRVIAHERETLNEDGTVTKVCTIPVTLRHEVWDRYDVGAYRKPSSGASYIGATGVFVCDREVGDRTCLIVRRKTPPIDPGVMAVVEAIESGRCEIPSRVVELFRNYRGDTYIKTMEFALDEWWNSTLPGEPPALPNDTRVDMDEVRRVLSERAANKGGHTP